MTRKWFNELFDHSRYFWIPIVITLIATYGFCFANATPTIDEMMWTNNPSLGAAGRISEFAYFGRWSQIVQLVPFNVYKYLPSLYLFAGLLLAVFALLIWCKLLSKASKGKISELSLTIFVCATLSFSFLAVGMTFDNLYGIGLGFNLLISAVCAFAFYKMLFKELNYILGSIVIIVIANLGMEVGFEWVLCGFFAMLAITIMHHGKNELSSLRAFVGIIAFAVLIGISLLLYRFENLVLRKVFDTGSYEYISGYINGDALSKSHIINFIKTFPHNYDSLWVGGQIVFPLIVVVGLILLFFTIKDRKPILIIAFIGSVAATCVIPFLASEAFMNTRSRSDVAMLFGFLLLVLSLSTYRVVIAKRAPVKYVITIVAAIIIYSQIYYSNVILYTDYIRYQHDVTIMNNVNYEVGKLGDSKPMLFLGKVTETYAPYEIPANETYLSSVFGAINEPVPASNGWLTLFYRQMGYPIEIAQVIDPEATMAEFNSMPAYPKEGYVRDCGDYILIKLGETTPLADQVAADE